MSQDHRRLASEVRWTRESHEPGDPLCVCAWCQERIEDYDDNLECVSCGCAHAACGTSDFPRCCDECDHREPILRIRLFRGEGMAMETAQFHPVCFDALLSLGILTMKSAPPKHT